MGYSTSITCLLPVAEHLKKLESSQDDTIVFKAKNPRKLATRLRQALWYINKFDTNYKRMQFTVSELADCVICKRKYEEYETLAEVVVEFGEPVHSVTTVEEVIGACLTIQKPSLYFLNYSPTEKELTLLQMWGTTQNIEFAMRNNKLLAKRTNA